MFSIYLALLFVFMGTLFIIYTAHMSDNKLVPGPLPFPIIGNLHLIGNLPHRALHKLSQRYGPIMSMRFGSINVVIVSSPDVAKLFLGTHDANFAFRPNMQFSKYLCYGNKGLLLSDYGDYWRNIRKFCTMELLSPKKLNGFAGMRREEMGLLVEEIRVASNMKKVVDLSEMIGRAVESMMCRMLFGKKYDETFELRSLIDEFAKLLGTFNLADYVPMLAPFDLQGLIPRFKLLSKDIDAILETLIMEHAQNDNRFQTSDHMSFIDTLLKNKSSISNDNLSVTIDRSSMKAILLDMVAGGLDTSTTSSIWVLSALIKNQRVMKKLQQELNDVVGDKLMVDEADLQKLSYLNMVIKEAFRLYPVTPLLVPHVSKDDIVINGYDIPKQTQVIVNVWAFGRDPKLWSENWSEFLPERFLDKDIEFRGNDFQLLQFGTGRRGCPAMNLGLLNVGFLVSNLVHCFDWTLPDGMSPSDLDMNEKFVMSMAKVKPLLAIPSCRIGA